MHLAALNRRILMTPFHDMAIVCSCHTQADVDVDNQVFRERIEGVAA